MRRITGKKMDKKKAASARLALFVLAYTMVTGPRFCTK